MNAATQISPTELERETGFGKDLLRKWRSRYGFPNPLSGEGAEQGYAKEQIVQLRLIRRLLNSGFRPNQVVGKPLDELQRLLDAVACSGEDSPLQPLTRNALELLKHYDLNGLDNLLVQARGQLSLTDFIEQSISPLVVGIGDAWARGDIEVHHEHLFTSILTRRLLADIGATKVKTGYPKIVFATPSDELHMLGLLMAQAVLADQGADCINVGPHLPLADLEMVARGCQADIVALSFSFAYPKWRVQPLLKDLRAKLPATTEIWAGGAGSASIKTTPKGISIFTNLQDAVQTLSRLVRKPDESF